MILAQKVLTAIEEPDRLVNYALYKSGIRAAKNRLDGLRFDRKYNVSTESLVRRDALMSSDGIALEHSNEYRPTPISYLRVAFDRLPASSVPRHFVDVGCGYGRACFYASQSKHAFSMVTGFDFDPRLVAVAHENLLSFKQRKPIAHQNIEFMVANARTFKLPIEPSCVFMCNPFDGRIMRDFLEANANIFPLSPVTIIYANDYHRDVIEGYGFSSVYRHKWFRISILQNH